ncbi:hypothetical protein ACFCX4_33270 [Kitasatospora sp. NPDC056327]|uniref:hypothetical protein n=1 Tax=Kitasatospora sp. NPDC056327 TaxID=3345785 RepID=UPI0035DF1FB1
MTADQDRLVSELTTLLADTAEAARRHGWTPVDEAVAALASARPATVVLCASPQAAGSALAERLLAAVPGAGLETAPLEPLATDPLPAVRADRVLLALGCAELLGPAGVEAAVALAARPPGTVTVVLTGAEELTGPDDLDLVAHRVGRLLDPETTGHRGAAPRVLFWSDGPAAEALRGRLAEDEAALHEALSPVPAAGTAAARPALLALRAAHLLGLADALLGERLPATGAAPAAGPSARAVAGARAALEAAHREVLRVLEAEAEAGAGETAAGLGMLRQNLLRDLERHLQKHREELSTRARAGDVVDGYLERGIAAWAVTAVAGLNARAARVELALVELQQRVDTAYAACGAEPPAHPADPGFALDRTVPGTRTAPGAPAGGPGRGGAPSPEVLAGGVLGAAAGVMFTGGLAIALTAGVGAGVGGVAHHYRAEQRLARAVGFGEGAVRERLDRLAEAVPRAVRDEAGALRRTVEERFARTTAELDALAPAPGRPQRPGGDGTAGAGPGPRGADDLAGLLRRLNDVRI